MDDEIIGMLRSSVRNSSADQMIAWAARNVEGLDQFGFIRIFNKAFPQVPLRILKEASTSRHLVGQDGLDDTAINRLLGPWLKVDSEGAGG